MATKKPKPTTKRPTTTKRVSKPTRKVTRQAIAKKPVAKKVMAKKPVAKKTTTKPLVRETISKKSAIKAPVVKRAVAKKSLTRIITSKKFNKNKINKQGLLFVGLGVVATIFLGVFILPNVLKSFTKDKPVLGVRTTGVSAPYTVELFAIEVLKSIAEKKGVPVSDVLTFPHVHALVAFALGEGGDVCNKNVFNLFNSGIKRPDLTVGGIHNSKGNQSFISFDAGVDAIADTMVYGYQSRVGDILSKKSSTAKDFMRTLTYYTEHKGNKPWAGEDPSNLNKWYNDRIGLLKTFGESTNIGYARGATTQIGTSTYVDKAYKATRVPEKQVYDFKTGKPLPGKESVITATVPPRSSSPSASTPASIPTFTVNTGKITYAKWVEASDGKAKIKFGSDTAQDWYQLSCNDNNGKLIDGTSIKLPNTYNSKDTYRYSDQKYTYTNRKCFISGVKWNGVKNVWGNAIVIAPPDAPKASTIPTPVTTNKGKITYAQWVEASDGIARIKFKSDIAQDWYQLSCNDKNGNLIIDSSIKLPNTLNAKDNYRYSNDKYFYNNVKCFISGVIWNGTKNIWGNAIVIAPPDAPKATTTSATKTTTTAPKTDSTAVAKKLTTLTINLLKAVANSLLTSLTGKK